MSIDTTSSRPASRTPASADHPTVVTIENVSKKFVIRKDNSLKERIVTLGRTGRRNSEEFWALKNVNLTIPAGSTIGLLGPNGSGKSTLLKAIGGIIEPTTGSIKRRGRLAALLELGAGFHPDLTGRENVFLNSAILGMSREETEAKFDDILNFAGIGDFIETQVKFYSSGMYVRLAFAVAIHTDPDVLLVDEVLAVGDEAFQRKCMDKIHEFQEQGRTIILVSHSLGQVQELCDRAVVLAKGEVQFEGSAREAVKNFRDILEDRRVAEATAQGEAKAEITPGKVLSGTVRAEGRAEGEDFRPGDNLIVTMEYSHETPLDRWNAGFKIENNLGQPVYGTSSKFLGITMPPMRGTATVEFRLENVQFGGGAFFLHAFFAEPAGPHIAIKREAARFVMADDPDGEGTVRVSSSMRQIAG
ncbi:ABC-2 type transport system ATP-binding protein [Frondihabitans sp. PhB188]|uniref:ABC transporter ATP-binding protein n=1 Tax=Frondihabitans sp. PhB188 TaxID=2485200 RepID=UPI000F479606|nr:ABC transporter ATP-binding protein [Frondihabitans sp. PhB188]ROQ36640.1 ABC-2 type transport system ATP-binding protein [Frondihabitans sp. PhB188]